MGKDLEEARQRAYEAYDRVHWQGKFCRRDIGKREAARREREPAPQQAPLPEPTGDDTLRRPQRPGTLGPRRAQP
jgi:hypothetical protein